MQVTRDVEIMCLCGRKKTVTLTYRDTTDSYYRELEHAKQTFARAHNCRA